MVIEYIIFDLDGLLLDSEAIHARVAESVLDLPLRSAPPCNVLFPPGDEEYRHKLFEICENDVLLPESTFEVQWRMETDPQWGKVPFRRGAIRLIAHLHAHGIPMAIASTTSRFLFWRKTQHLPEIAYYFGENVVCVDDEVMYGKRERPYPGLLLEAAAMLGRNVAVDKLIPSELQMDERAKGLVFDDAFPGTVAAKQIGMKVAWVPEPQMLALDLLDPNDLDDVLGSLEDFVPEKWGLPPFDEQCTMGL